jgi:hypothetical protein
MASLLFAVLTTKRFLIAVDKHAYVKLFVYYMKTVPFSTILC